MVVEAAVSRQRPLVVSLMPTMVSRLVILVIDVWNSALEHGHENARGEEGGRT